MRRKSTLFAKIIREVEIIFTFAMIEYKKEAFNLFNEMMGEIQSETVRHIFRAKFGVQIVQNEPVMPDHNENIETELTRALKTSKSNHEEEQDSAPFVRPDKKIGRNELCPCGSGKKFKQCCGKNKMWSDHEIL